MRHLRMLLGMGLVLAVGCAPTSREPGSDDDTGDDDGSAPDAGPAMPATDFPSSPILEPGVPANAPELFMPAGTASGGPCVLEPELGTLFPRGWLRPRFSYEAGGFNLFEIRLHAASQVNDLVIYTTSERWTMPYQMWSLLNAHTVDDEVTVTVRGGKYNGSGLDAPPAAGAPTSFKIAPVGSGGTIAYWTSSNEDGAAAFKGFKVGEETVHTILTPSLVQGSCVGCHSSSPDGNFIAFSTVRTGGDGAQAHIEIRKLDGSLARPEYATPSALSLLDRDYQQQPTFSRSHWSDTDRVVISMFDMWDLNERVEIIWTDLLATSDARGVGWDTIKRIGDSRSAGAANFSHDGSLIAYTSSNNVSSGVNVGDHGDLFLVPYNNRMGGTATPVPGASEPNLTEHYPAFSPDDKLLGFMRGPATVGTYDNPVGEIFVIPTAGGTAARLGANDPVGCTMEISPGVTNSWPKWAPDVGSHNAVTYYWLTFSSRRGDSGTPQLYITGVTVDEIGSVQTYPAIYLWNQPEEQSNHTPAWDNFQIIVD